MQENLAPNVSNTEHSQVNPEFLGWAMTQGYFRDLADLQESILAELVGQDHYLTEVLRWSAFPLIKTATPSRPPQRSGRRKSS